MLDETQAQVPHAVRHSIVRPLISWVVTTVDAACKQENETTQK
jgi:hypothetical protein